MAPLTVAYSGVPAMAFEDMDACPYDGGIGSASSLSASTAYHGSQGYIDRENVPSISLEQDGFDDISITVPPAAGTSPRPNIGSRLLSTLSTAQAAAAPLTRSGSVFHARARSWAAFVPKISSPNPPSPEKAKVQQPNKLFGDLFNGESAPVRLGIPTSPVKEDEDIEFVMEYQPTFTERPARVTRRMMRQPAPSIPADRPTTARKTSWFTRKTSAAHINASTPKPPDDLLNMDIDAALFPFGPADALSPHAFNDLLLNATSLLEKMQAAYREKVEYIASIQPEIDAQREEVEEAQTRAEHLKIQLADLAHQSSEQSRANRVLVQQLSEEKAKVQTLQEEHCTIRLVRRDTDPMHPDDEPRRWKRGSAGSASDSGFESDADTSSVFSAGVEPTGPQNPKMTLSPEPENGSWSAVPVRTARPTALSGPRTISSRSNSSAEYATIRSGGESAAWATVEKLRHENQGLRGQMEEMHRNLQTCIDFVGHVTGA